MEYSKFHTKMCMEFRGGYLTLKKIVFFDIDGTLLDDDKQLPASTLLAIQQLQAKGIYTAIATGRGPFMVYSLLKQLEMDTFISYNGQLVISKEEIVYRNPLETNKLSEFEQIVKRNQHSLVYMGREAMYSNTMFDERIQQSIGTFNVKHPAYNPEYFMKNEIYQSLLFIKEEEESYLQQFNDYFDFVRWHELAIDVVPKGGSKAEGIKKLVQQLEVDLADVYAFGDGLNDIEMLQTVGTGVAMGNASDRLKQHADFITSNVSEDGIHNGLKKLGLI